MLLRRTATALFVVLATTSTQAATPTEQADLDLDHRFADTVRPFMESYCVSCHSGEKPKGDLDLKGFSTRMSVVKDTPRWMLVREKVASKEMPPEEAKNQPSPEARQKILAWIDEFRKNEASKNAGDPGNVLARRLSNAEYDYTIRDLTGVDLRPTREFPVDPSNTAGFDNSGESLAMSPSLLNKYLKAAREVATHLYLKQDTFAFSARAMLSETDRDKFCESQIVNFYHTQSTDYADYFQSAWRFKNRAALGKPDGKLADLAINSAVSPKYLATVWGLLEETREDVGPVAKLQAMWRALPAADPNNPNVGRAECEQMRDYVVQLRKKIEPRFTGISAGRGGGQATPIWLNTQYATHRMTFDAAQLQVEGEYKPAPASAPATQQGRGARAGGGGRGARGGAITNAPGDPDLSVPAGQRARYEASFAKFCSVFPDRFYTQQRGTNYFNEGNETGRLLSAGFLNRMGYFRDDIPFYELILDKQQQAKLDTMWEEMDFIANVTRRTFLQSFDVGSDQARALLGEDVNAAPDEKLSSEATIKKYTEGLVAAAAGSSETAIKVVQDYYNGVNERIRWTEKTRIAAEPKHLEAMLDFATRAYRRPLTKENRDELLAYYRTAREKDGLDHESALRDTIAFILLAPEMTYRVDLIESEKGVHPLSDYDLASRLSYFLWASMPDAELLSHAAAGDLHDPKVIVEQTRRMIRDPRVRGMAVEFGGNWLDFRRFEDINTVDHQRFPSFSNDLRDAMFEEPVRFLLDVVQKDRSILDVLYSNDTFVNPVLAKHYGMPEPKTGADEWTHITDASAYSRGGILPMAAFLTKNAPGLRTSPVKRGNWVMKNVLGERISPPPAGVPVLPNDEAKMELPLREVLARHRADPSCSGCHERFDSFGLVFEGFGPVGEKRDKDLAGHAIDPSATFPGGSEGAGLDGLRKYISQNRQNDYIDNVCGKLLVYALGRSLIPSDDLMIQEMHAKLAANGYRFDTMIESIVTSPQFLTKRGREALAER